MFSEVVKLVPQVDQGALRRMFATLNQRFSSVASKFGTGLKRALQLTPLGIITGAFLSKLLNPLQKAEEILDRILKKGNDATSNAEEFNTTPGKLLRLDAVAQAKGLDADTLHLLLGRFQLSLAKEQEQVKLENEKKSPANPGILRQFVGDKDVVESFFSFIQSVAAIKDKSRQTVVQTDVFGERIRGKATEFFNTPNFADILGKLPTTEAFDTAAKKTGDLNDKQELLTAIRESQDFIQKSKLVDESQINAIDKSKRVDNQAENESLKRFDSLKTSAIAVQELTEKFDKFTTDFVTNVAPALTEGIQALSDGVGVLTPLVSDAKDLLSTGFDSMVQGLASLTTFAQNTWSEFKTSRIYKFLGGSSN